MPGLGNSRLTTGVQYSVKTMFDRTVYFPHKPYNNIKEACNDLATTLTAVTGVSGGSLKRVANGRVLNQTNNIYFKNYKL